MASETPVIFIIFNRPDVTERTFAAIRRARPQRLFVVADGPREDRPEETKLCAAARAVVEHVDWPCEVFRDYSEINLGCGKRPASGITRAFEQFEEAIILEDDCLPDPSFFPFCNELLRRYHDDERVMAISGNNLHEGRQWNSYSYYFSKYCALWGWATWRRAWKHYDFHMSEWPTFSESKRYELVCPDRLERDHWRRVFSSVVSGRLYNSVWDYQFLFTCWLNNGLIALPRINLVSNIGFRPDGTHCLRSEDRFANLPTHEIGALIHPPSVAQLVEADNYSFEHVHGGIQLRQIARGQSGIRRLLRSTRRIAGSVARRLGLRK